MRLLISATEQMRTYKPAEHEETTSVAPLMQFFELVHIGDTMQSMVQVYFDKELVDNVTSTRVRARSYAPCATYRRPTSIRPTS